MKVYIVKISNRAVKSFVVNRFGEIKIHYSKPNGSSLFIEDKDFALKIANLLGGKIEEVAE